MSGLYKIPNNYRRSSLQLFYPAYLREFGHFFYANLDDPISDADFANWRLSLFDNDGNEVASDIGTIMQDFISGSNYRFYANFIIPTSVPTSKIYYLVIYNISTDEVKYQSNCIKVILQEDLEYYVYLEYRNSSNIFKHNYEGINDYNNVFLELNLIEQQPEIELQQYVEQTTGKRRNQKSITSKVIKMESFFFDDEANDMMLALSVHDDIVINGKTVDVKTAHQIVTNRFNGQQKGEIEFYDQEFSTINLNG